MATIPKRRFTKSKKVWEISLEGTTCIAREGKGAPKKKKHASEEAAIEDYVARVSAKLWERWVEEIAPGRPAPPIPGRAPDLDTQREKLRTLLEEAGLSAKGLDSKPAIALRLRRMHEDDLALGASRFGGRPDLASATNWPVHVEKKRERPLDFVAQFRLEDLAPLDEAKLLPKSGLLSFFVLGDWDADNPTEPDYLSVCRVLHTPAKERLERRALAPKWERTWNGKRVAEPYPAHAVEAFSILTMRAKSEGHVQVMDAFRSWLRGHLPGMRGTHLLGYRSRDGGREPKQILLFQSETDYSTQMLWGDADFLHFWVTPTMQFERATSNYAD